MSKVCSYNAQGEIECVTKKVETITAAQFDQQGKQQFWKEQHEEGVPIGATEPQIKGKSFPTWIGNQPEVMPLKDPVRDLVIPPYTSENMDWKRYEKPIYPFAASEWNEKTKEPYAWIPKVEAFTNKQSTWTSRLEVGTTYASPDGNEVVFEDKKII